MLKKGIVFFLFIVVVVFFSVKVFHSDIDADEVEHVHVSWLLNKGVLPYKNIHQIHMPFLWVITSGILQFLPEDSRTFLILRGFTFMFFILSIFVGVLILKKYLKVSLKSLFLFIVLALILGISTEFYRFRPDPFMSFFGVLGVYFILNKNNRLFIFLSGVSFGISLSFSLKIFPLLFVIFFVKLKNNIFLCFQRLFYFFSGIVVGVFPVTTWLIKKGIIGNFWEWVILHNLGMSGAIQHAVKYIVEFFIALFFVLILFKFKKLERKNFGIILISFALSFLIRVFDPNHLLYNWQLMILFLLMIFVYLVSNIKTSNIKTFHNFIVIAIVFIIGVKLIFITKSSLTRISGWTIPPKGIDILVSWNDGGECVGFSPYHPVFCRDATQLYLLWDYFFMLKSWVPEKSKYLYREMWNSAVDNVIEKNPKIIVAARFFKLAYEKNIISKQRFTKLYKFLESRYEKRYLGKILVFIKN